jgi:hypothetical protein
MGWAVPSVSEASLASLGATIKKGLGVTKKEKARGDKKGESSGRQKRRRLGAIKRKRSGRQKVAFGAIKGALRDLIVILFYL